MKRNFLVVASDARVRESLAGDLRAMGFSVTRAVNGAEAERVVRSVSVDAVLAESNLPDMSGDELAGRVRWAGSLKKLAGTPVRLKFYLTNADLYAIQFGAAAAGAVPEPTGVGLSAWRCLRSAEDSGRIHPDGAKNGKNVSCGGRFQTCPCGCLR